MKLFVVSEGPRDVGKQNRVSRGSLETRGAVTILDSRLVEELTEEKLEADQVETSPLFRLQRREDGEEPSGLAEKVKVTLEEAARRGCTVVAVVVDRDGKKNDARLDSLRTARNELRGVLPLAHRTAVGLAIETVEAWLLADVGALNRALQPDPPIDELPDPESIFGPPSSPQHPKHIFESIGDRATRNAGRAYDAVAEEINLRRLRDRCKRGFGQFADEMRDALRNPMR